MKKRRFSRDVAVQIMYQLGIRGTDDYAKLLSHYEELCASGDYEEMHRTFMDGFVKKEDSESAKVSSDTTPEAVSDTTPETVSHATPKITVKRKVYPLDYEYLNPLFGNYVQNREKVDDLIKSNLRGWQFGRIAAMDLAILRIALTEILFMPEIPFKSSVNEAVEIAKQYGDEKSKNFINGLLANYVTDSEVRSD